MGYGGDEPPHLDHNNKPIGYLGDRRIIPIKN